MSRLLTAVFALVIAAPATAERVRVAVLPLEPLVQASSKEAQWIEGKLLRELKDAGATVVTGKAVADALAAAGKQRTSACDTACLLSIGKALGVDRVVASTLSLQRKVQSLGTAWVWRMEQVHVPKGVAWGTFQKMCMCPERFWDHIAAVQVKAMLSYDPAARLQLPPGTPPAAPTKAPKEVPGMVYVPAGPFIMGSDLGEWDDESPRHLVELSAFYIDKYEVTNAEYGKCAAAGKCLPLRYRLDKTLNHPNQPAVAVGWDDAVAYCRWAGKRLVTEAEWEKAARGTDERSFPWGNEWNPKWTNMHNPDDGFEKTAPVGSFPKNVSPYGAYDMAGNAWEWTLDYYNPTYYRHSPPKDPQGPKGGVTHTMRGGSWMYDVPFFQLAHNRSPGRPWIRKQYVGVRCAKSP